jgi:hypothetical protein
MGRRHGDDFRARPVYSVLVEGSSDGARDDQLPGLLDGAVPDGTPVAVNRVPGSPADVGEVGR